MYCDHLAYSSAIMFFCNNSLYILHCMIIMILVIDGDSQ